MKTLKAELAALKAELAAKPKPPKPPPLDPDTKELKALQRKINESAFTVRAKISKALIEQSTSVEARLAALKSWNALGANKGRKGKR